MSTDVVGIRFSLTGATAAIRNLQALRDSMAEVSAAATEMAGKTTGAMDTLATSTKGMAAEIDAANTTVADSYGRVAVASDASAAAAAKSSDSVVASSAKGAKGMLKYGAVAAAVGYGFMRAYNNAANFGASMTLLATQAQVPQRQLGALSNGVLNMARSVGTSAIDLSGSLYHVESAFQKQGISVSRALNLVKTAAEGAKIGHADLVDVTNALNAVVVSGIKGANNFNAAMGQVNATVGAGDMTMQNYADEMKTGLLATAKNYGLTLKDVNAATAVFGDNLMRGTQAATYMKQLINVMGSPSTTATKILAMFGLGKYQLGTDLRGPNGMLTAIQDLHKHTQAYLQMLERSGISPKAAEAQVSAMVTAAFGRSRGSASVLTLMNQIPRLMDSYKAIAKGANSEQKAWNLTTQTSAFKAQQLSAAWGTLEIKLGQAVTPAINAVKKALTATFTFIAKHKSLVEALAIVLGGVLVAALYGVGVALAAVAADMFLVDGALAPWVAVIAVLTLVALAAVELATHWHEVWTDVKHWTMDAVHFIKDHIYLLLGTGPIGMLIVAGVELAQHWQTVWADLKRFAQDGVNGIIHIINAFIRGIDFLLGWTGLHIHTIGTVHFADSQPKINAAGGVGSKAYGPTPHYARGGVTNGPMAIVGEGNPAHPEYIIPTDPTYRDRAIGLYQSLGAHLFKSGGIWGDITGGLSAVGSAIAGGASSVWNGVTSIAHAAAGVAAKPFEVAALALADQLPAGIFRNTATGLIETIYNAIAGNSSRSGSSASSTGPMPVGGGINSPAGFAGALLSALGDPQTSANLRSLVAWENMEGGAWHNTAAFNPLNTTLRMPGSHSMNSVGVQAYTSWAEGLQATVKTLSTYGQILAALSAGTGLGQPMSDLARWSGGGYNAIRYAKGGILGLPTATYDTGGYLPVGPSIAINNTGSPELVPGPGGGGGQPLVVNVVVDNKVVGSAVIKDFANRLARR